MKKIICLIIILFSTVGISFAIEKAPTNVKFISQSCTMSSLFITVIDLDANEIIILQYHINGMDVSQYRLSNVIRTGMKIDPNSTNQTTGTDAPFKSK